jgi:hypothetical protein
MTDDTPYEVIAPEGAVPNLDGSHVKFTFSMKNGPNLSLAIPSQYLFPLAAMSFVAANQVSAIAGNLANQQILQAEAVDVHSGTDFLELHFRLTGTHTDIPLSITRQTAQALVEQLAASLAQGSSPAIVRQ